MNNLFTTLFSTLRAKFTPLWTRARLFLSPTFWTTRGVGILRSFFSRIFDVKPKHKKDYYPLFRWLVSKRLAFAIVIAAGALGIWYIFAMSPLAVTGRTAGDKIPTYKYTALALKFHSGEVRILARDKHIAYIGEVKGGRANGQGRLFDAQDALIYSGQFQNSMYEGQGELHYPDGTLRYSGDFSQNLFHGEGMYFRPEGTAEYIGAYSSGLRSGFGELYNPGGNKIFSGMFRLDKLVYAEFVGKTAVEAAEMYTGRSVTYSSGDEYCVHMSEIDAVYAVQSGEDSIDEEWRLNQVYVLDSAVTFGGRDAEDIDGLFRAFGEPDYMGLTWVTLPDAVAVNLLEQDQLEPIAMTTTSIFDEVVNVAQYDGNREIYIYVFKADGLVYTFYCENGMSNSFLMYSIEQE